MIKGQKAPRTITKGLRAKAWWVLRKNRTMTLAELLLTVCDGTEKNAESNLRTWLNTLTRCGFLTRQRVAKGAWICNGSYRYSLVRDIGPRTPVMRLKQQQIYDPNSGNLVVIPPLAKREKAGSDG